MGRTVALSGPATVNEEREQANTALSRFYSLAGMTIRVTADLPITEATFDERFREFAAGGPGSDNVHLHHHFGLPDLDDLDLDPAEEVYRAAPWAIYRGSDSWIYLGISPDPQVSVPHLVAVFSRDHTEGHVYHSHTVATHFGEARSRSLTFFPTDQILVARLLADRAGCYLHSSAVRIGGRGFVFVGHSGAGKSTAAGLLRGQGRILCDDRNIVRRRPDGWRVYGTWSHGDLPDVSRASAPLRALLFLRQAPDNRLVSLTDPTDRLARLFSCVVKPLVTREWWEQTFSLLEQMAAEVPCYELHFDRSGALPGLLGDL